MYPKWSLFFGGLNRSHQQGDAGKVTMPTCLVSICLSMNARAARAAAPAPCQPTSLLLIDPSQYLTEILNCCTIDLGGVC